MDHFIKIKPLTSLIVNVVACSMVISFKIVGGCALNFAIKGIMSNVAFLNDQTDICYHLSHCNTTLGDNVFPADLW